MRKTIGFKEGFQLTLSNEGERGNEWFSFGYEKGESFEDISVEISISDLCEMSAENIENLKRWLVTHAETEIRAAVHKRDEEEARQKVARDAQYQAEREAKKANRNKVGYIYLVEADNGFCKIGKTKNVTNRVNEFGVKLPMKTRLVHSFQSSQYDQAEIALHEKYSEKRSHGEWFALTQEDIAYICSIQDNQL